MERLGVFAAWVGIVAFVLAIPMAVCANLLTPHVKEWWGYYQHGTSVSQDRSNQG